METISNIFDSHDAFQIGALLGGGIFVFGGLYLVHLSFLDRRDRKRNERRRP